MEHSRRRWQIGILSSIFFSLFLLFGSKLFAQESLNRSAEFRIAHGYFEQAKVLFREQRYGPAAELIRGYVRTARFQESRRLFAEIGQTGLGGRGNSDLSALWARTLVGLGQLAEAQSFLSGALRRFPQSPQIYTLLAEVLTRQGKRTAAAEVLQRGINEMPAETELMYRLAALERDSQKRRELVSGQEISDQDQNGIAEATVDFEEGGPRKVALSSGSGSGQIECLYSDYPFLESASLISGTSRREYRMVPYAVRLPAFVSISTERFALQLRADLKVGEGFIRNNAYQAMEYSIDQDLHERSVRRTHLLEGRTVRIDELPDSAGHFTRTLFYTASLPVEGIRDLDGDGVNEFEQILEGDLKRMYWDYNDDGLYDIREFKSSDGTVVRGFSSLLHGAYDLIESREDLR